MFQRSVKILLTFTLFFIFTLGDTFSTLASTDTTAPTIKSVKIDKTTAQPGEDIHIQVEAEDVESGISDTTTHRVVKVEKQNGSTNQYKYVYLTFNPTTKKYEGTYSVPSNTVNGLWYISWIYFVDKVGNTSSLYPSIGSSLYQSFNVTNGNNDTTAPTIKSIKIDKTTAQPGEDIHIQVEAEDVESG
ncbi:hypothetical protein ABEX30_26880, partial [Priestia aryabhattai]|uniref:hypothetical protein n=1 Tax=Priestia aryabhattai TaxID=412384 RepID=UPI003D2833C6